MLAKILASVLGTSSSQRSRRAQRRGLSINRRRPTIWALGHSIAYGFQPAKAKAWLPPSGFKTGYVDVFAARLRTIAPKIRVVNYACPGESTKTFIQGGCSGRGDVKGLHDAFKGAQLNAALAFLRAHPGPRAFLAASGYAHLP